MASMKAKKGNPFEYHTLYSFLEAGYDAKRFDDNKSGIDLVVNIEDTIYWCIECKNRKRTLSWNQLHKIWKNSCEEAEKLYEDWEVYVVFKSNHQPCLVYDGHNIMKFDNVFCEWKKRPKGHRFK